MSSLLLALLLGWSSAPSVEVEVQDPGEPVIWALNWQAPAGCPTRDELFESIRSYLPTLEQPPLEVAYARLRVDARVEVGQGAGAGAGQGREWIVQLRVGGEMGESTRSFAASSCQELAAAVALVAAVALDPVLVSQELAHRREAAGQAPPVIQPPMPEPEPELHSETELELESGRDARSDASVAVPVPSLGPEVRVGLQLTAGGGFGPTDTGYGALAAGVSVFADRWRWSLDGGAWLPRTIREPRAAGRFHGWWLGTRACVVPNRAAIELPLCGGVEAGQARAAGLAPAVELQRSSYPWLAFTAGGGLNWVIVERVALVAGVSALIPVFSREFVVGDLVLQRGVPAGVRATLGVELRLGARRSD